MDSTTRDSPPFLHWTTFVLVACLIVALPAQSETPEKLTVDYVEALGKIDSVSSIDLVLLENTEVDPALSHASFSMTAMNLRVETDRSVVSVYSIRPWVTTEANEYMNARLEGVDNRPNYRLSLWPITPVTGAFTDQVCGHVEPSSREVVDRAPLVDTTDRDSNRTLVDQSLILSGCSDRSGITLKGDFLLRLWEWDAELTAEGETTTLQSGRNNQEALPPGSPDPSDFVGEAQEQFIYAYNATLEIPRLKGHYEIYVGDTSITAREGFLLPKATGSILGIPLDNQDVYAVGPGLAFNLARLESDGPVMATYDGEFSHLEIDGKPMDLTGGPMDRAGPGPAFWLMSGLVLAGLLVVLMGGAWVTSPELRSRIMEPVARRRDVLFNEAIIEALEYNMDRPQKKLKWTKLALALKPNDPEALAAMAEIYFYKRRYRKALFHYTMAIKFHKHEWQSRDVDDDAVAFWATDCVRSLAMIRLDCRTREEREQVADQIMLFVRMAAGVDPDVTKNRLAGDPLIADLWDSIQNAIALTRIGVRP